MTTSDHTLDRPGSNLGRPLVAVLVFATAFLVFYLLAAQYDVDSAWFAQNNHNARFIETHSYTEALSEYRKTWPPLYPTLVWGWARLGLSPQSLSTTLWFLVLVLSVSLWKRRCRSVHCVYLLSFLTVAGSHALIVRQLVAETLFVFLALLLFAQALSYIEHKRLRTVVAMGLTCATVALTRYFGGLWLGPLAALVVLATRGLGPRKKLAHLAVLGVLTVAPVAPWLLHVHAETGYLTGTDRFDRSETSRLGPRIEHVTPKANLIITAKTLYLDAFSAREYGKARRDSYEADALDLATLVAILVLGASFFVAGVQRMRDRRGIPPDEPFSGWLLRRPFSGALLFTCVVFFCLVLLLWSIGNNDPINTRFLFPIYPFVALVAFDAYGWWKRTATRPWQCLPCQLFFVLVMATNLHRHWWTLANG